MSDRPKRPRFRFHLLTAVLMMLTAGALISFSLKLREQKTSAFYDHQEYEVRFTVTGWPLSYEAPVGNFNDAVEHLENSYRPPTGTEQEIRGGGFFVGGGPSPQSWYSALINLSVGLLVTGIFGALCESIIRRREARKA